MQVLIVEDNKFNAFCLTRMIEATCYPVHVTVASDSVAAMIQVEKYRPALVIMDGDLGAHDAGYHNGPALADMLWQQYPQLAVVAWTDSDRLRLAFAEVFQRHNKRFDEYNCWTKIISQTQLLYTLTCLETGFNVGHYRLQTTRNNLERLHA